MNFAMSLSRRGSAFLGLALLLWAGAASAQMYKWVDANGKTHFTDTPPPATAKAAPIKSSSVLGSSAADLPYALASAVRAHPVVLWTTSPCPSCESGRAYLKSKGIPFTEKTVATGADEEKLRENGGDGRLPMLFVGRNKLIGYQQSSWNDALNAASYPERSLLPPNYQYGSATSAAPKPAKAEPDQEAMRVAAQEAEEQRKKKAAAPTAPPGFQF
jgi:glutaredoxin